MKSIIKYIIGGMGLLSITSCSDFLDQSSPSEIKGDMVFNSLTFTEQSICRAYPRPYLWCPHPSEFRIQYRY